ncbi:MAG: 50S ribosomal protein L13 [Nanoarchaeota archaeon]|nr:50S ribosomal protein L13 [Nanoarchaeota archaeon]MEC8339122.1 50S ribosomal protein L13 [Nanoarchaeota archaeon]
MASESKSKDQKYTIIDGKDLVLGRLGSDIAKRLLLGESIKLVNCQEVVILGRKKFLVERYKNKISNKVIKQGPYYSRAPSDIVRRAFRNMLPYKNQRGIDAYKRLKCFNSVPAALKDEKFATVESAQVDKETTFYYTQVGEICKSLGYTKMN